MNVRLNRTLFQQTDADSGALTMLTSVVHRPAEVGDYLGTVYRGDQPLGEFALQVREEETPLSVHIDVATVKLPDTSRRRAASKKDDCCPDDEHDHGQRRAYEVGRGGYVVFHVSEGMGGYSVQLANARGGAAEERREGRDAKPWSSADLQEGDLFAVTLLRPGTYRLTNQAGGEGKVKLAYPTRGPTAYRPPEPVRVSVTNDGFQPSGIELQALQGLVFEVRGTARISITLVEPDDGPERADRRPELGERGSRLRYTLRRRPTEDARPR